ncbi:uncharacterized protein K452DRAFT_291678 [Aplosporella prunicola CBS 121167]|uniref:Uncharacterized protein n=1 Tax=Aplosporella prunicola CBS 121167 TaxID=1176127 RepID=A0A6A6AZQ6_9PEZI|nr:uncharacterized protein K452DRAFT_291678 [Aplosporella prunicola CBS 121167]KAF2137270.1 hypothetical protein K452DRAFT_291678 [Aplosporella prunicola CBS 121167]
MSDLPTPVTYTRPRRSTHSYVLAQRAPIAYSRGLLLVWSCVKPLLIGAWVQLTTRNSRTHILPPTGRLAAAAAPALRRCAVLGPLSCPPPQRLPSHALTGDL